MFQNFAKNTCTGMKFKAICYELQNACELPGKRDSVALGNKHA